MTYLIAIVWRYATYIVGRLFYEQADIYLLISWLSLREYVLHPLVVWRRKLVWNRDTSLLGMAWAYLCDPRTNELWLKVSQYTLERGLWAHKIVDFNTKVIVIRIMLSKQRMMPKKKWHIHNVLSKNFSSKYSNVTEIYDRISGFHRLSKYQYLC